MGQESVAENVIFLLIREVCLFELVLLIRRPRQDKTGERSQMEGICQLNFIILNRESVLSQTHHKRLSTQQSVLHSNALGSHMLSDQVV